MPNILALTDKATGERIEGIGLVDVDEKLCAALGVPLDEFNFYMGWVDWMALYLTNDWSKVQAHLADDPECKPVLDWLEQHYSLNGYAMVGRR